MKTFVVVACFVAALQLTASQEVQEERQFYPTEEDFTPKERECIKELNIKIEELQAVIKEITKSVPENNPLFITFLNCFWVKDGYQLQDGAIVYENVIKLVSQFPKFRFGKESDEPVGEDIARKAVEQCQNLPAGENHGQTAAKVQNCVTQHIGELVK